MQTINNDQSQQMFNKKALHSNTGFFKASNTTYHWTPVLQLVYDSLNTDDNSAGCSLNQSSLQALKYIPLE